MNIRPKAFIFDLDGTLLDTLPDMIAAFNQALAEFGMPTRSEEEYRSIMTKGVSQIFAKAVPEGTSPEKLKEVHLRTRDIYKDGWTIKTGPFPGVIPLLERISDLEIPMSVLSNKPHYMTDLMVRHFFPEVPFVNVQGAVPEVPSKPDPAMALTQLKFFSGIPTRDIFFVGDDPMDVITSHKVETTSVAVTWGFRRKEELLNENPHIVVHSPDELRSYLAN